MRKKEIEDTKETLRDTEDSMRAITCSTQSPKVNTEKKERQYSQP